MKAFLLVLILFSSAPLLAKQKKLKIESEPEYQSPIKGARSPIKTFKALRKDLPHSSPGGVSYQKCSIYSKYLVHETYTGQIGADSISIRRFGPGDAFEKVCDKKIFAREIFLKAPGQVFEGANEDFILTRSADSFGEASGLWVYDGHTGQELFAADYNLTKEFTIKKSNSGLILSYFRRLEMPCSLSLSVSPSVSAAEGGGDSDACWEQTLSKYQIPPGAGVKKPDCQAVFEDPAFKTSPSLSKNPAAVQVFVPVQVFVGPAPESAGEKKAQIKITFQHGAAICKKAP